ncbi:MAG: ABC transporter permease, partial [Termitinemataceae bacterium]
MKIMRMIGALLPSLVTLASGFIVVSILVGLSSPEPQRILKAFFGGPWSSPWFIGNTLDGIGLLLVAALGIVLAFRGGTFNLGGEGQIYAGGLAGTIVLLSIPSLPGFVSLVLAALGSALIGALIGGFSGLLKRYTGADELITSFLFSAALTPVADYLIAGPLRDPAGNLLATKRFSSDRILPHLLPPSNLNISLLFAFVLVVLVAFLLYRTAQGYRFRVAGSCPSFAEYGGIQVASYWGWALFFSGALHGLTGFFAVSGTYGLCHQGFPGGLGWSAIAVALIGKN